MSSANSQRLPAWLLKRTFEVQYNPNCPKPFLVRLVAPGQGSLDRKPYAGVGKVELTKDITGVGETLRDAANEAKFQCWLAEEGQRSGEVV